MPDNVQAIEGLERLGGKAPRPSSSVVGGLRYWSLRLQQPDVKAAA